MNAVVCAEWPLWAVIWLLVGIGYTVLVRRLSDHHEQGAFWSDNAWLLVMGGNALIGFAVLSVTGDWGMFALFTAACFVLGGPQIVGALVSQARKRAEAEREIANG